MLRWMIVVTLLLVAWQGRFAAAETPAALKPWLEMSQNWRRDTSGPILSLGKTGQFDDTHIFAPAVDFHKGTWQLWYCGSTGRVANRVFQLGRAISQDGKTFTKGPGNPVFSYGDGKHSILTPTVVRDRNGGLRMWFSSTWFAGGRGLHTLHETRSSDGTTWSKPSPALLNNVYAPTVLRNGQGYRMWYVDVGQESWIIRHAASADGQKWNVTDQPCLVVDQAWEKSRLFYPMVVKIDNLYMMWYGSYWSQRPNTTALGFATSTDGLRWYKHPQNPVLRPDPSRAWESHYVTSHCVLRQADGSLRIWYASRTKPPFAHKYFAINTAVWKLP